MSAAKHTPGPSDYGSDGEYQSPGGSVAPPRKWQQDGLGRVIAVEMHQGMHGAVQSDVCSLRDRKDERAAADAKLIAAAPDLVDGINAMLGLITLVCSRSDMPVEIKQALEHSHRVQEAKDALAKAGL